MLFQTQPHRSRFRKQVQSPKTLSLLGPFIVFVQAFRFSRFVAFMLLGDGCGTASKVKLLGTPIRLTQPNAPDRDSRQTDFATVPATLQIRISNLSGSILSCCFPCCLQQRDFAHEACIVPTGSSELTLVLNWKIGPAHWEHGDRGRAKSDCFCFSTFLAVSLLFQFF